MGIVNLSRDNGLMQNGKSVLPGALVTLLAQDGEVPPRRRMRGKTDTAGSDKKGALSLHDIDHLFGKGDFHDDLGRIMRSVGRLVIGRSQGKLGATPEKEQRQ